MHRRPLVSRRVLAHRLLKSSAVGFALLLGSLAIGTVGYHLVGVEGWLDAEYNAAMILTGMGPIDPMHTVAGKVFASAYALFSGVAFLTGAAVIFSPLIHRFLHRFHLEFEE